MTSQMSIGAALDALNAAIARSDLKTTVLPNVPCGRAACRICDGTIDAMIVRRGEDEYIFLNGRLLKSFGIPVRGDKSAEYYLHRKIGTSDFEYWGADLWPRGKGWDLPGELIDLYWCFYLDQKRGM
jgi:hypothetical protein